jgi:hypothetical protein
MNEDEIRELYCLLAKEEDSNGGNELLIDVSRFASGMVDADPASPSFNSYLGGHGA